MADNEYEKRDESGAGPSESASGPGISGDRRLTSACCHDKASDAVAGFPCAFIMRRHPAILSVIVALMGLACLAIATAMIVGVLRYFWAA